MKNIPMIRCIAVVLLPLACALGLALEAPRALAAVDVDISQGNIQPAPIAVAPFSGADPKTQELGGEIDQLVGMRASFLRNTAKTSSTSSSLITSRRPTDSALATGTIKIRSV